MTACFGYFRHILHVLHIHFPSASYHLTRWRKQTSRFVSVIWVDHWKVLWDWCCELYVWIVRRYLIVFLVLFSSFELHIVWLNHFSTSVLFDWTVPVAVHWLNSFAKSIEFDWTVYLAIYYLLNRSPNRVCWNCH